MSPLRPGISVVVPTYNSELSLGELARRLHSVVAALANDYEVILVDDSSRDGTWAVIEELAHANSRTRGVRLMRNYGQHNALLCGIRLAQYELTVTIDDDLQHPPEEIPKLLKLLTSGADVVYGTPDVEQHGLWRDIATQVTKIALQSAMSAPIARKAGAFRIFRTQLREAFERYDGPYVSIDVLLTWGSTRFDAVKVRHEPRRLGASNYTFKKLVVHALNMLTGFSTWPLQLASLVGFFFTAVGTVALLFVLVRYLINGGVVPGFSFLASTIAIFSGAQLFALGIIGEYLSRMHARSMQHPVYAVRESTEYGRASDGVEELVAAAPHSSRD
ncbi:MAG: glycosyltransferase family 2 protein [Candidatus Dormibacteraeota bacterium]|nr:glycosyltransferase family 2 protein [Candidatus Dormibacteraeota bacterium]